MTHNKQHTILKKLLFAGQGKARLIAALVVLCLGMVLLLVSVLVWFDFTYLLKSGGDNSTSSYLVIGKEITDRNMAMGNTFSVNEIEALKQAPQVQDVGEVTPARFPVYATIGGNIALSTDLPLESIPDRFIDSIPTDWGWQPGDPALPVILSTQFLDVYNYVFAPGQGLPQLSRVSVKSIALKLRVGGEVGMNFQAHVSGFSGRIGSVLAPQAFIEYGNKTFAAGGSSQLPSRLVLKVNDPSDAGFNSYLQAHGYTVNPQNLQWSRIRAIVEAVTGAMGILALLIIGISTLVFILFIELTVTRARESIVLLVLLGYSTSALRKYINSRFLPLLLLAATISTGISMSVQVFLHYHASSLGLSLPLLPGLAVWLTMLLSTTLLVLLAVRSVRDALKG